MSRLQAAGLQAGRLIEDKVDEDSQKLPTKRQLAKLEKDWDKIPTYEHIRRIYRRHIIGLWQFTTVVAVILLIWSAIR